MGGCDESGAFYRCAVLIIVKTLYQFSMEIRIERLSVIKTQEHEGMTEQVY